MADGRILDNIVKEGKLSTTSATSAELISAPITTANTQLRIKAWVTAVDGGDSDPLSIFGANLHTWLRSDLGITTSGGAVTAWTDQSGNGHNFSNGATGPTYNINDANWGGLPSLTFNGTSTYLVSDSAASVWRFLHDGTGGGAILIYRTSGVTDDFQVGCATGGIGATDVGFRLTPATASDIRQYTVCSTTTRILNLFASITEVNNQNTWMMGAYEEGRSGNEAAHWVDGELRLTDNSAGAPSAGDPVGTMHIGSEVTGANPLEGEIVEFIAFTTYPSAGQVIKLEQYLRARYVKNPKDILGDNLKLWLRSDKGVDVDANGNVKKWNDQSGNGHHFSQDIDYIRPVYGGDGYWGKYESDGLTNYYPTIEFTNSHRLDSDDAASIWTFLHDGTGGGSAIVYRPFSASSFTYLMGTSDVTPNTGFRLIIDPTTTLSTYMQAYNGSGAMFTMDATLSTADNGYYIISTFENGRAGNEAAIWSNGVQDETGNTGSTPDTGAPSVSFQIGSKSDSTVGLNGEILEVLAFNTYPTDAQIAQLNNYFDKRYFDGYSEEHFGPIFVKEIEEIGYFAINDPVISGSPVTYTIDSDTSGYTASIGVNAGTDAITLNVASNGTDYVTFYGRLEIDVIETEQLTPATIMGANLHTWLRSDLGITLNGSNVSSWADQSGNGHNISQGTGAAQPLYTSSNSSWSGYPSLYFDGSTDYMISDDTAATWKFLHDGTGGCVVAVYSMDDQGGSPTNQFLLDTGGASTANVGMRLEVMIGATVVNSYSVVNGTSRIFNVAGAPVQNFNEWAIGYYKENDSPEYQAVYRSAVAGSGSANNPSASNPTGTLYVGANIVASGLFKGDLLEVIIFNNAPTAIQLANLQGYLDSRYNFGPKEIFRDGLALWLRSDMGLTLDGNLVSTWADQSGNGHDFSQSTNTKKPLYNTTDDVWGGLPSLSFNGTTTFLVSNDGVSTWNFMHDGYGGCAIGVYRVLDASGIVNRDLLSNGDSFSDIGFRIRPVRSSSGGSLYSVSNGSGSAYVFNSIVSGQENFQNKSWVLVAYEEGRAGNEYTFNFNGTSAASGNSSNTPTASNALHSLALGAQRDQASNIFYGEILEIILVTRYPSSTELTRIANYINNRYGI